MLRIESIKLAETYKDSKVYFDYDKIFMQDINLVIGPNASGKSQFINRLKFLRETHRKNQPTKNIVTIFKAEVVFNNENTDKRIRYELTAGPGQLIVEQIEDLLARKFYLKNNQKGTFLLDENTGKETTFLLNKRQSITKQVEDHIEKFPTINEIGKFFENILFLDADKFNLLTIDLGSEHLIPSDQIRNISSVVLNWKDKIPKLYDILLKKYKSFFPYVEEFTSREEVSIGNKLFDVLAIKEKGVKEDVPVQNISSGMLRILCLLALPMTKQIKKPILGYDFSPSVIVIDEIDNGLDYEMIYSIIDSLKSETVFSLIILSSHSPVVCNFIPPENWLIFRRSASRVKVTNPLSIKETKELIERSKTNNWEIYKNHIANSRLYSVK